MKQQQLAFPSLGAGLVFFLLSFIIHGFVYSELLMGLSILFVLLGLHWQTAPQQEQLEQEESAFIFINKHTTAETGEMKAQLQPVIKKEKSEIITC